MALECLACNHGNSAGDRFCSACGSSLDLRLCPGCEAVNRRGDTSCHSCGAKLAAEAIVPRRAAAAAGAPRSRIGRWIKGAAIALPVAAIAALAVHAYGQPGLAEEVAEAIRAAAIRTIAMAAEVMKRAVARLENYLDKLEGYTKGTVVLATANFGEAVSLLVVIADGSHIQYTDLTEVENGTPITVEGIKMHILGPGKKFVLSERKLAAEATRKKS